MKIPKNLVLLWTEEFKYGYKNATSASGFSLGGQAAHVEVSLVSIGNTILSTDNWGS